MLACPCCKNPTVKIPQDYEICHICHWEDEIRLDRDDHPGYEMGANHETLESYRKAWKEGQIAPITATKITWRELLCQIAENISEEDLDDLAFTYRKRDDVRFYVEGIVSGLYGWEIEC